MGRPKGEKKAESVQGTKTAHVAGVCELVSELLHESVGRWGGCGSHSTPQVFIKFLTFILELSLEDF